MRRFFRRHDGTILTRDCLVGWKVRCAFIYRTIAALALSIIALFAITFYRVATGQRPLPGLLGKYLERCVPFEEERGFEMGAICPPEDIAPKESKL